MIPAFQVNLNQEGLIVMKLETSDLQENASAYAVQISGEPRPNVVQFINSSEPLLFNTSFHGLCYSVGLLIRQGQFWSRPVKTVSVLTSKNQNQTSPSFPSSSSSSSSLDDVFTVFE